MSRLDNSPQGGAIIIRDSQGDSSSDGMFTFLSLLLLPCTSSTSTSTSSTASTSSASSSLCSSFVHICLILFVNSSLLFDICYLR